MKLNPFVLAALAGTLNVAAISAAEFTKDVKSKSDVSFQHEVQHAIDKGLAWLTRTQDTNGFWSTADHPAVTALALQAYMGEPSGRQQTNWTAPVRKGFKFILGAVQPNGGIYREGMQNYNTALSLLALTSARKSEYADEIRGARQWLAGQQIDQGTPGKVDSPYDGGIGYGSKGDRSDMNNTLVALEALYYSKQFERDAARPGGTNLNWDAVIHFLQSCQNLPERNKEAWVSTAAKDKGGFVYEPGESKAGGETNAAGKVALRSYGSISYAGLLSYIYADLQRDDPRVVAVLDWLANNFTLRENPGMGPQGYYYYLHLMTKALTTAGVDKLKLDDGATIDWRKDVAMKLINLQRPDGSWLNDNGRWWEKDPALVTAYSLLALEMIHRGL